jgi:hypothetical protein
MTNEGQITVRLTDVFDADGNMVKIVADNVETGDHVADFLWDPRDPQDESHRTEFREWVRDMLGHMKLRGIN